MKKRTYKIPSDRQMREAEVTRFCDNIEDCDKIQMSFDTMKGIRGYLIRNGYNEKVELKNDMELKRLNFIWNEGKNEN